MKYEATPEALEARQEFEVQQLLSPFRERPLAVEPPEVSEGRLHRIVPELEFMTQQLISAQRRRRTWLRGGWLLAALATGVGAGLLYGRFEDGPPRDGVTIAGELVRVGASEERTIVSGTLEVGPLGQVETRATGARLSTEEGLDLELGPSTSARVGQLGSAAMQQRVRLDSGTIHCRVPKLGEQREFSVVTPDALVVVHGTRFSVEVRPEADRVRTCVRVTEGKVSVHGAAAESVYLHAGESFGCDVGLGPVVEVSNEDAAGSLEPGADVVAQDLSSGKGMGRRGTAAPERGDQRGTLAQETSLLQAAVRAEQRGDVDGAKGRLQELVRRYPQSPLAEEARLMLDRLSTRQP